jgi:hypothetical protein
MAKLMKWHPKYFRVCTAVFQVLKIWYKLLITYSRFKAMSQPNVYNWHLTCEFLQADFLILCFTPICRKSHIITLCNSSLLLPTTSEINMIQSPVQS